MSPCFVIAEYNSCGIPKPRGEKASFANIRFSRHDTNMTSFRTRWFERPGLEYAYHEVGEGPAVLLLHGFTGSKADWTTVLEALAGAYRVIAVDLPGHGESGAPEDVARYGMAAVTEDLGALLDHLEVEGAHMIGYSMGARLALFMALVQPSRWRSLLLESGSPGLETEAERAERRGQDEALAQFIEREGVAAFVERWERLPLFATQLSLPEEVKEEHREGRLSNRPEGLAGSLRGMGTGTQPSLWERLEDLTVPTLVVVGELDEKFVVIGREMLQRMPQALLTAVPQTGHTVHLERPDVFATLVQHWLAQIEA